MSRPTSYLLWAFLVILWGLVALLTLSKGGFYVGKHEGDTLHMLQLALRMADGEWPHLNFETPIGVLAVAPVALFVALGVGVGHAYLAAQLLVAAIAMPAIFWVARSRMSGGWAYVFAFFLLLLITALVHGEADPSVSVSMYYNRWAWAAAFLAITVVMLPPEEETQNQNFDGIVVGVALAVLALVKMTYFMAFALPILIALIARKAWRSLGVAVLSGLVIAAVVTLAAGTPLFWFAYARDLFTVASSDIRAYPGLTYSQVASAPAYIAGSVTLLLGVVLLRQVGRAVEGMILLLLVPGFFYVTYQNYGNDPQWLAILGFLLVMLAPQRDLHNGFGWNLKTWITGAGVVAFVLTAPSVLNLTYSPFRHASIDTSKYVPLLPGSGKNEDFFVAGIRGYRVDAQVPLDEPGQPFALYGDPEEYRDTKLTLYDDSFPNCSIEIGTVNMFRTITEDLEASGLVEGRTLFAADLLSSFWLFGGPDRLPGASPWYYGGLPGIENADYLMVPMCPLSADVRGQIFTAVEEAGIGVTEVRRNDLYALYTLTME